MRPKFLSFAACGLLLLAAGCQKNHNQAQPVDTGGFKTALDSYYQAHPSCVWNSPQQMPIDLDEHKPDPAQEQQLDALVKAGLLTKKRTDKEIPAEDHHRRHRERVIEYTLTDQGKSAWTTDTSADTTAGNAQSAAGNFCVGSPHVVSIGNAMPAPNDTRYSVSYRFALGQLPAWATNSDVQAAFPAIAAENSEKQIAALAVLSKTPSGWKASAVQPIEIAPPPTTTP